MSKVAIHISKKLKHYIDKDRAEIKKVTGKELDYEEWIIDLIQINKVIENVRK